MSTADDYSVAIVGMACRFPGALSPEEFWQNLKGGVESIRFFSDAELAAAGVDPTLRSQPNYVPASGALGENEIAQFDAGFFGISPREAGLIDPQHRLFLECAWETLECAGYDPGRYRGSIGVFGGAALSSYLLRNLLPHREQMAAADALQVLFGNDRDSLTTRVAYKLNLRGPSYTLQTFCSTSLVAVHVACQALLQRECDMALAGGVTLAVPQVAGYLHAEGGLLSPDGHCRAFDAEARGTPMGSGVGLVLLKPLTAALQEGDTIRAVIRGSAINNDGSLKVSYAAPGVEGQAAVVAEALAAADVHPDTISYLEAHGSATALGDPIEIAALDKAWKRKTSRRGFCAIGSVKTNVGHLDRAAGIAGLIKTVLALEHEELPASLHYQKPNPQIDFASTAFFVNARHRRWEGPHPLRAGVSAFGVGGTNAHVVLERAPAIREDPGPAEQLLVLSARSPAALAAASERLARHLANHADQSLADVAFTLQVGRRHFEHRRAISCRTHAEAMAALSRPDPGSADALPALARRWLQGHDVDWTDLGSPGLRRRVPLPTYPFERQRFWIDPGKPQPAATQVAAKKPDPADWFYLPAWREAPVLEGVLPRTPGRPRWLLLSDGQVGQALAALFRKADQEVALVHRSERFEQRPDGDFGARIGSYEDLRSVLHDLERAGRFPDRVVHLWGLDDEAGDEIDVPFSSALAVGKALGERNGAAAVAVDVVTRGAYRVTGQEGIRPHQAMAVGLCRVLPQEYASLACRHLDLSGPSPETASEPLSRTAAHLARELGRDAPERTIALRHGKRWALGFEPVRLEPGPARARPGGVYLVVGGLGGIGLVAARVLAEAGDVKLVLTGRSAFPDPGSWDTHLRTHPPEDPVAGRIRRLRALQAQGAEVVIEVADVADGSRMRDVVEATVARFGALHGVVFAAGVVALDSFRTIQEMTPAGADIHFRAKVHGLLALERALADRPLDFCLLISSVSAQLGGLGYAAYAAASAFVDAFACSRAAGGVPWMSVAWSDWKLAAGRATTLASTTLNGSEIDENEGAEALRRLLSVRDQPQLVHSTVPLAVRLAQWVDGVGPAGSKPSEARVAHPRPDLATPFEACQSEPERLVAEIWQQLLGLDRVGRHDDFFELGGNSLIGTQLADRLRRQFRVAVPLRALFEVRTPAETAILIEELLIDGLEGAFDANLGAAE
jgi:acyl transferase domain-containing protein